MSSTFGDLLKHVRKRAGMSQNDLAAAIGYSRSMIGALERNQRLPDIEVVIQVYLPALSLQEEPLLAAQLVELAAVARGEQPPPALSIKRERRVIVTETLEEAPHHLPHVPTRLVGRDQEINHLCNRLLGHNGRLLTLVGPPGVGKTRLAQAVGAELQPVYKHGVCFVPLAAVTNPALVASTLVTALQLQDRLDKPPQTRVVEYLRHKEMLLLLDNFEQIIDAVPLVAELLAECAGLHLLVTSRERLHLRAEQRYRVPPLSLASAVALFTERATAVDPDFVLVAASRTTIEAICHQIDCLPLAIELCAAQVDLLPPIQLLARLQGRRLELLVDGARDLPLRHRTLHNAIQHSYDLLDEAERTLFRTLGVFVGGFDVQTVETVSAWHGETSARSVVSTLHSLMRKSLVHTVTTCTGEQRFLLLETIREFAGEQLLVMGEKQLLHERHYAAYLQLFRTGDGQVRGPDAAAWLARLEPEQDNLRAALQWVFDEGRYEDAAWLMLAVTWFWHLHGNWYEQGRWITHLLPHRHVLNADVRLAVLLNLWAVARALEEFQPFDRWADEIMNLLEVCSHKLMHSAAWHFTAAYSADFLQTSTAWERSIALARAAGEVPGLGAEFGLVADCNFILGTHLRAYASRLIDHGELARAVPLLKESLAIFQARENHYETVDSLGALGRMAFLQGDLVQAHKLVHEAVTIAADFNYQEGLGSLQPLLGLVTLYRGDRSEARRLLWASLRLCLDLKDKVFLAQVCHNLAELELWEDELDQAQHWLAQSLSYHADPHGSTINQVERLFVAARLATAQENYQWAATLFGLAEQANSHIHHAYAGPLRARTDVALSSVRAALGPDVFAEAFSAGQRLSLGEAFAMILHPTTIAA